MPDAVTFHAGDSIDRTLTFTLAPGEEAARITLLLTRTSAQSEHPAVGRARCIVLEANADSALTPDTQISMANAAESPRTRFTAQLHGVIPRSICGGSYSPVFCIFGYKDARPDTGFEIDADQRFSIAVADDAAAVDPGPAIVQLS